MSARHLTLKSRPIKITMYTAAVSFHLLCIHSIHSLYFTTDHQQELVLNSKPKYQAQMTKQKNTHNIQLSWGRISLNCAPFFSSFLFIEALKRLVNTFYNQKRERKKNTTKFTQENVPELELENFIVTLWGIHQVPSGPIRSHQDPFLANSTIQQKSTAI